MQLQCNAAFTRLTQQCYHCETTVLGNVTLTMLKTILEDKEINAIVLIGCCYKLFELEDNTETQCGFPMSASVKSACFSGYAPLFWAVINCFGIVGMFNSKDALEYGLVVGPS